MKSIQRFLLLLLTLSVLGVSVFSLDGQASGYGMDPKGSLPFTDVRETSWYYPAVSFVYENGLMIGMTNTLFAPNQKVTRAMAVAVLYRMEGSPDASRHSFRDVPGGSWYADAVGWAAENGIVYGVTSSVFAPNQPITREQMIAIMNRYVNYRGGETLQRDNLNRYSDCDGISAFAVENVKWAVAVHLITGRTASTIDPKGMLTRSELAKILMNLDQVIENNDVMHPNCLNVPILRFPNVDDITHSGRSVTSEVFESYISVLCSRGYHAVSYADLIRFVDDGTPLPSKPVVITFDSGFQKNMDRVYEILKKYGFCAELSYDSCLADEDFSINGDDVILSGDQQCAVFEDIPFDPELDAVLQEYVNSLPQEEVVFSEDDLDDTEGNNGDPSGDPENQPDNEDDPVETVWQGKSLVAYGTSITYRCMYFQPSYLDVIQERFGFASYLNNGHHGIAMANGTANGSGINRKIRGTPADIYNSGRVSIECCTNDFRLNVPLGAIGPAGSSFDTTTFTGALQDAIEYIFAVKPTANIILLADPQRDNSGYTSTSVNSAGFRMADYVNRMREIAQMYGIPLCNWFDDSGINMDNLNEYTTDGLHPNVGGYMLLGETASQVIERSFDERSAGVSCSLEELAEAYCDVIHVQSYTDRMNMPFTLSDPNLGSCGVSRAASESRGAYLERLRRDFQASRDRISAVLDAPVALTYPYGLFSAEAESVAKEIGFRVTVTTRSGKNVITRGEVDCLYLLNRTDIPASMNAEDFAAVIDALS